MIDNDSIFELCKNLKQAEQDHPLPAGWFYRRDIHTEFDGDRYVITANSTPERRK